MFYTEPVKKPNGSKRGSYVSIFHFLLSKSFTSPLFKQQAKDMLLITSNIIQMQDYPSVNNLSPFSWCPPHNITLFLFPVPPFNMTWKKTLSIDNSILHTCIGHKKSLSFEYNNCFLYCREIFARVMNGIHFKSQITKIDQKAKFDYLWESYIDDFLVILQLLPPHACTNRDILC